jgi:hypothetical protein
MPDFATHLRTVHFTLILACMITLVSLIGGVGTEVERAHEQLYKVIAIKENWYLWLNRWALEEAKELEKAGINQWTKVPSQINVCLPSAPSWQFRLRGSPLQFFIVVPRGGQVRILADAFKKVNGVLQFQPPPEPWPVTLDDFKAFWNSAHDITVEVIESIDPEIHFIHADGTVEKYSWTALCPANSSSSLDLQYRRYDHVCSNRVLQKLTGPLFCGDIPKKTITVAVGVGVGDRSQRVMSNLRSWLVNKYSLQAAGVGFEKDFAALSKVTTHYAELKLPQVQLVLEAELQRSGERVQLVGLTLPLKMLSLTTVMIILAIQFYFLLHLWQFQPSQKDTEVAWVGLYDNLWARAITLVTGLVLPFFTIIFVMAHSSWWYLILVTVSAVIAFFSFPLLWKLPCVPIRSRWAFSVIWKDIWRCTAIASLTRFTSRQHRPKK